MESKREDVVSRAVLACSSAIQPVRGNRGLRRLGLPHKRITARWWWPCVHGLGSCGLRIRFDQPGESSHAKARLTAQHAARLTAKDGFDYEAL